MLWNYLIATYRNLVRFKVYSAINIVGLAIGIAFSILTILYVRHEWSFDAFHEKERIYRVYSRGEAGEGNVAIRCRDLSVRRWRKHFPLKCSGS